MPAPPATTTTTITTTKTATAITATTATSTTTTLEKISGEIVKSCACSHTALLNSVIFYPGYCYS